MPITIKQLQEAGFRADVHSKGDLCTGFWQKRCRTHEPGLTRYFINVYQWAFPIPGLPRPPLTWSVEVRMHVPGKQFDLNLMVHDGMTVKDIEDFYTQAFTALGCIPDPDNN